MSTSHTAHSHPFHVPHLHLHSPHVEWHDLDGRVLGALAVSALIVAAAITVPTPSFVQAAIPSRPAVTQAAPTYPDHEIPREWRSRHYPSFDSMYRNAETPRLDWIRNSGAR
jgi:hypothetical protein